MEWDKLNRKLLPVPWASFPSEDGPLLVKLLYLPAQNNLAIMATDLQHVYYESLNSRQTNRRFEDALLASKEAGETQSQTQTQSQDVMVGIGTEGETLLHTLVDELVGSVTSGTARTRITHAAFEDIVYLTTPSGLEIRFLTTSLETASAATLASHLVSPLLGICSGLLSLLREDSADQDTLERLYKRIEGAIDASGTAERIKEGRAAETFARVGGPALLGRWIQHTLGVREKDLVPVSLSLPSRPPRLFSPLPPSNSRSTVPVPVPVPVPAPGTRTPHRPSSPSKPSVALTPPSAQQPQSRTQTNTSSPSVARRMLDHHSSHYLQKGERIEFDSLDDRDSQHQTEPDLIAVDDQEEGNGGLRGTAMQPGRDMVDDAADKSTEEPSAEGDEEDDDNGGGPRRDPEEGEEGEFAKVEATAAQEEAEAEAEGGAEEAKRKAKSAEREAEEARRRERLQRLASTTQVGGADRGGPAVKKKKKRL